MTAPLYLYREEPNPYSMHVSKIDLYVMLIANIAEAIRDGGVDKIRIEERSVDME
jgi:hypothetical protein